MGNAKKSDIKYLYNSLYGAIFEDELFCSRICAGCNAGYYERDTGSYICPADNNICDDNCVRSARVSRICDYLQDFVENVATLLP